MMASPLVLLQEIEQGNLVNATRLQQQGDLRVEWRGVGFKVGELELVAPMLDVTEILDSMDCTRIPGSKEWFNGIANIRGALVPVMDFYYFLYKKRCPVDSDTRIIVFKLANSLAGLVVSGMTGLRNFYIDESVDEVPDDFDEALMPYVKKSFNRPDKLWPIFDFNALASSEAFLNISEL